MHQTHSNFNLIERFFLYCAGSDLDLLLQCRRAEQIKHIGFGTLVLVPAILALVSMTYALSTLEGVSENIWIAYLGGMIWSLIIFAFDRFIVSSHRRKTSDLAELKRPVFYLRFSFALILGIVISHPLLMLYFNGSIEDQMNKNLETEKQYIYQEYNFRIAKEEAKINYLDSVYFDKLAKRDLQAEIVAKEIDGEVIKNVKGELQTTGLRGKGPSAENKIAYLSQLEKELKAFEESQRAEKKEINKSISASEKERDSSLAAFSLSTDYLHQERALEQLKEGNPIVSTTQWLIMLLFVLVDLLPFIFKTFSTYGLYDRILGDEEEALKSLEGKDSTAFWQERLEQANQF